MGYLVGRAGRIDDAKGGWKGRGLWATYSSRAPFHMEHGEGAIDCVLKGEGEASIVALLDAIAGDHDALRMTSETEELNAKHTTAQIFSRLLPDTSQKFLGLYNDADAATSREAALRTLVLSEYSYTLETLIQAGARRMAVAIRTGWRARVTAT